MKNFLFIFSCIYIFCYFVFELCCACGSGSIFCSVEQWVPWGLCNSTCGGGVQERQKSICCDSRYHSLKECLNGCNIPFSWWQANATEYKTCGKCQRGGTFNIDQNQCSCPYGFGGSCCDSKVKTVITSAAKILSTTQSINKLTGTGRDKDDCARGPCQYGTCHDTDDDFHCDCLFFSEGKMCNKLTSWAIAGIALSSLTGILACCCCYWWIIGIGKKDDTKKTAKPMNIKIKPKPMERRCDKW